MVINVGCLQDLNLPKSITQRLAKGVLPPNTQIQKDAVLAMSKSATVFVNYLTSQYVSLSPSPAQYTLQEWNRMKLTCPCAAQQSRRKRCPQWEENRHAE
jgi:hypothetical protein